MDESRELLLRMLAPAEDNAVDGRCGLSPLLDVVFVSTDPLLWPSPGVACVVDGLCGVGEANSLLYDQGSDLAVGTSKTSSGLANADITWAPPVGLVALFAVLGRVGRPGTLNEFFLPNSLLLVRLDLVLTSLMGGGVASSVLEPPVMVVVNKAPPT
jgi:hypothetical protein